jgi:hypothetical protein
MPCCICEEDFMGKERLREGLHEAVDNIRKREIKRRTGVLSPLVEITPVGKKQTDQIKNIIDGLINISSLLVKK